MRLRSLALLIILTLVALPLVANHSWGNYHWGRTANPFTVKLGDNVTSAWDKYLQTASTDWSKSSVLDTVIVAGQASTKRCRATTGRVEVCNAAYGFNGWLGVAGISVSGGHITAAYVKLNDSYFNSATYNTPAWRNMVMCQEIGHAFGLDHQDETFDNPNLGTCMDYTNDPSSNQHPNAHDYEQLETIYAHTDSVNTAFGDDPDASLRPFMLPPAIGYIDFAGPEQWGAEVRRSADGRTSLYVLDFGAMQGGDDDHGEDGFKIFTFVTWAPFEIEQDDPRGRFVREP